MNCIRFLFCFYNFIFLVIGGAVLGIGIWFAVDPQAEGIVTELLKKVDRTDQDTSTKILEGIRQASFVLIAFGGFIFLLSFLGYCGSIKESRFLLGFYAFLLGLILILEILAFFLVFYVYGPQIENETKTIFKENLIQRYGNDGNLTVILNDFMVKTKCCGIYNGTDFQDSTYLESIGYKVPEVCCKNQTKPGCMQNPTTENSFVTNGCFEEIKKQMWTTSVELVVIAAVVVIGILQLIGIVFSCWIYKEAKYSYA